MSEQTVPKWVYTTTGCLDITELSKLGAARPVWTNHFCTWKGFKDYVCGCLEGERIRYGNWSSPEEWDQAVRELQRKGRRCAR